MSKKTFIFYKDWEDYMEEMTLEEKGLLIQSILAYQNNREIGDIGSIKFIRSRIKKQLDEDNKKRDEEVEKRKIAGRLGGKAKASKCKQVLASASKCKQLLADNENVNDNVTVNVNKIYNKIVNENLVDFLTPTELDNFVAYWSETIQQGKYKGKERWEGQKTWDTKKRINTWNKNKDTNFGKEIKPTNDKEWVELFDNIKRAGGRINKYQDELGEKEYARLYKLWHKTKVMDVLLNN